MGCVASRIDKPERVQICKERKRLMKQLVRFRGEFAEAQLSYLSVLKNTGVTLRQFTESESLELDDTVFDSVMAPSPPPTLPPSPPPPPTFSPDLRHFHNSPKSKSAHDEIIEIDEENSSCTPPPPPLPNSNWDFWDPFESSLPHFEKEVEAETEEENWAETNSEFEDEDQEDKVVSKNALTVVPEKRKVVELIDDNSSIVSWQTKDTEDMKMVVLRSKKTLRSIVKELDDYFLKASAGGKDVTVLMDVNVVEKFLRQNIEESKRKRSSSAKVFNALAWSWSSKSQRFTREAAVDLSSGSSDPCKLGAHCTTLEKIYAAEKKLYMEVKDEETKKLELERKILLLKKLQDEDNDFTKIERTRLTVETLQCEIESLRESIGTTCSSILKLIDEELHPQLTALTFGLMHMWRRMYECHQVQNHISQQLSHLPDDQKADPTSTYHQQAAIQLKAEVASWYNSFFKVTKSQRDYVRTVSKWLQLTDSLIADRGHTGGAAALRTLCHKWQSILDRLPDKAAAEAIKSLLLTIHSIMVQQQGEVNLQKSSNKIASKLQRELNSYDEMETKFEFEEDKHAISNPRHPLNLKRAKIEALKKLSDEERSKYLNAVEVTKGMTLSNLQASLPNVFRALMGFSITYADAFEAVHNNIG